MTAEVVVLNKNGVAIAADSAVTVRPLGADNAKIFKSVNKLFNISPGVPVAIMVYGNAEYGGIPWEALVKSFRLTAGTSRYPKLQDYAERFIEYIDDVDYDQTDENYDVAFIVSDAFRKIKQEVNRVIFSHPEEINKLLKNKDQLSKLIDLVIRQQENRLREENQIQACASIGLLDFAKRFRRVNYHVRKNVFDPFLPLSAQSKKLLLKIAWHVSTKTMSPAASGVVFAGYGDDDLFPGIQAFCIDGKLFGKLKLVEINRTQISKRDCIAAIVPFAQQEMVFRFYGGS